MPLLSGRACSPIAHRIPLQDLFAQFAPTDMIPGGTPERLGNESLWPLVFGEIEREHEAFAPEHWLRFRQSVAKRQRTPVLVNESQVINGHHRIWALFRAGKKWVRVRKAT